MNTGAIKWNAVSFLKCLLVTLISCRLQSFANVYHGVKLGDFPPPDFKTKVKLSAQRGSKSFQRVILPSSFKSVPDLVSVYASSQDGANSGFQFEGTGACHHSGAKGNYAGVLFAYDSREVYIWAPTKYSGNTNGNLIFVGDGWGGGRFKQASRTADVTIVAWNSLPPPNFHTNIQVDKTRMFYEVPHNLRQIPDFISVRVYSSTSLKKEFSLHFHASGAVQTPSGSAEYGGVVFAYNESLIRLWLPNNGNSLKTGCIWITEGWGNGRHASQLNSKVCHVEIRAWMYSFPLPAFQTEWESIHANAERDSFREIQHNIGKDTLIVQVQVKREGQKTNHFIYDGIGSVQSTQSTAGPYGGVLFAYDKQSVRIWVASSDFGDKGKVIFVSDAWGNGTRKEEYDRALYRIRIFAHVCDDEMKIADGQGVCRDAQRTGLIWQASPTWSNCSTVCSDGIQQRKLTGMLHLQIKSFKK